MTEVEKYTFIRHISSLVEETYYLMDFLLKDINYKVGVGTNRDEFLAAYKMKEAIGSAHSECSRADDFFMPDQGRPHGYKQGVKDAMKKKLLDKQ